MIRTHLTLFAVVLGLALVSPAFSADKKSADKKLAGSWILVEMNGKKIEGRRPTIAFTDKGFAGFAGVNRFFGSYAEEGDQLFDDRIGTTRKAGPPELMALERSYLAALQSVTQHRMEEKHLILEDGDKVKLVFKVNEDKNE